MQKGWERLLPPAHFEEIYFLIKAPSTGGSSPTSLNKLCLFHEALVNKEKVLNLLKLKSYKQSVKSQLEAYLVLWEQSSSANTLIYELYNKWGYFPLSLCSLHRFTNNSSHYPILYPKEQRLFPVPQNITSIAPVITIIIATNSSGINPFCFFDVF